MALATILVIAYFTLSFIVGLSARKDGLFARRRQAPGRSPEAQRDYVLGPGLRTLALLATMAATNFSAFTVFGLSGVGYRLGWAYYPIMGFGTGLMALSFILLGVPLRRLSALHGFLTPADFIAFRYRCPALGKAFSVALIALTLPYLATQAIAGGRLLEAAAGIPYALGSLLVVGVTALYTLGGGFRAVTATDGFQVAVLIGGSGAAFAAIIAKAGGFAALGARLAAQASGRLARSGEAGALPFAALIGTWLLWCLADPLFPQITQRFYAAKDDRSLRRTAAFYPLVTGGLFFMTIGVGVAGAALLPGLSGSATEQVFTKLAIREGMGALSALFVLAALAALMSTMDSQLLTVSSMLVQDFVPASRRSRGLDRALVAGLALLAWLASLSPPTLILDWLGKIAFPGYAILAPILIAGLFSRVDAMCATAAFAAGALAVTLEAGGFVRLGHLPAAAVNLSAQILVMAVVSALRRNRSNSGSGEAEPALARLGDLASKRWFATLAAIVASQADFWNYAQEGRLLFGLPIWVLSSAGGCVALSAVFALWKPPKGAKDGSPLERQEAETASFVRTPRPIVPVALEKRYPIMCFLKTRWETAREAGSKTGKV